MLGIHRTHHVLSIPLIFKGIHGVENAIESLVALQVVPQETKFRGEPNIGNVEEGLAIIDR